MLRRWVHRVYRYLWPEWWLILGMMLLAIALLAGLQLYYEATAQSMVGTAAHRVIR